MVLHVEEALLLAHHHIVHGNSWKRKNEYWYYERGFLEKIIIILKGGVRGLKDGEIEGQNRKGGLKERRQVLRLKRFEFLELERKREKERERKRKKRERNGEKEGTGGARDDLGNVFGGDGVVDHSPGRGLLRPLLALL